MKIGLLGHGTIGLGVDHICRAQKDLTVKSILSLVVDEEMAGRTAASIDEIVSDPEIDTVVEVMGGVHPAFEFIEKAMKAGKNVVTANKAVVAACYPELLSLAKENRVSFRCTAAVGGGIPWLVSLERAKRTGQINEVSGIMNGTTNYILNRMTSDENTDFSDALSDAQALGYAEKDPSADIDGLDIRRKLNISCNIAFDVYLSEETIPAFGIRSITKEDILHAKERGCTVKLMAFGKRASSSPDEDLLYKEECPAKGIIAYVEPVFLPADALEAHIPENYNLITLCAKNTGRQSFFGEGAGRYPTAANVVQDLLDIQAGKPGFYTEDSYLSFVDNSSEMHSYYLRTSVKNDFITYITAEQHDGYLITKPVSTAVALAFAEKFRAQDPGLFIAGLME